MMGFTITPESPYRYDAMEVETRIDQIQSEKKPQPLPLPTELIIKILHDLPDFEDRLNFSLTCREIRAITFAEEKPLRVNQIRFLLNLVKIHFDEKISDNLNDRLHNLDEHKNLNFLKINKTAIKIELFVLDCFKIYFLSSNPNPPSIELFKFISAFLPKYMKHVILIHFFKKYPHLTFSELNTIITYAGDYEAFRKIIRLAELLVSDDDFVRYNIVSTFFHNYEGEETVTVLEQLIELSGSNLDCISLINPFLKATIESHIKSGVEENLQEAIRLALLLPEGWWKYYVIRPIIDFYLNNNSKEGLQKACELACSLTLEERKYSALEPIIRTLTQRGDVENLYEVAKLGSDDGFKNYITKCINIISHRAAVFTLYSEKVRSLNLNNAVFIGE